MATGYQTTSSLADSLETLVHAARTTREFVGVMSKLVDVQDLDENAGITWNEVTLGKLTASGITETTEFWNPQLIVDSNFPLTPTVAGIHTVITDRMRRRISKKVFGKIGQQAQQAIERKKDIDLLTVLDGFTSLGGAGTVLTSNYVAAAKYRITSNATEPGKPPFRCVLHGFQIKAIDDELRGGVGTYPIPEGPTANVFKSGFKLPICEVEVYEDGNITVDSSSDAKGGVFAREGVVLVRGRPTWTETRREPHIGGGADSVWAYDEYVGGERLAAGTTSAWGFEMLFDASTPSN